MEFCKGCDNLPIHCSCDGVVEKRVAEPEKSHKYTFSKRTIINRGGKTYVIRDGKKSVATKFNSRKHNYPIWQGPLGNPITSNHKFSIRESKISVKCETKYETTILYDYSKNGLLMAKKINNKIKKLRRQGSGSFFVTMGKDIIKPVELDQSIAYIHLGNFPNFKPIFNYSNRVLDMSNGSGLRIGDLYPYPLVGLKYKLSSTGDIQMNSPYHHEKLSKSIQTYKIYSNHQASEIVKNIRRVKQTDTGRFYVNPWGLMFASRDRIWYYIMTITKKHYPDFI